MRRSIGCKRVAWTYSNISARPFEPDRKSRACTQRHREWVRDERGAGRLRSAEIL